MFMFSRVLFFVYLSIYMCIRRSCCICVQTATRHFTYLSQFILGNDLAADLRQILDNLLVLRPVQCVDLVHISVQIVFGHLISGRIVSDGREQSAKVLGSNLALWIVERQRQVVLQNGRVFGTAWKEGVFVEDKIS